jgi:ketosteroid isomerase-like protein
MPAGMGGTVKGWSQNQTLVRARIEAMAPTEAEATLLAGQVQLETASGILRATGPDSKDNRWWSVSWEVFTPHATDLNIIVYNGENVPISNNDRLPEASVTYAI